MTDGLPEILLKLLEARGLSGADLERYLSPSLADLRAPEDLPGIAAAADVILGVATARKKIVVFGDYDCDGVCATAILVKTLSAIAPAAPLAAFLPERLSEGYGMSDASVTRLLTEHPDVALVVTVDNGINSVAQIAALKARGIRVVVTDHHLPGEELPAADALVNPKVAAPAHFACLCGAGVAFLLANRLVAEAKARGLYDGPCVGGPLLVLAGLATVTDIMPLLGQNRILVSEALKRFRSWAPVGLCELYARAARNGADRMTSRDFGFLLGPRINAAGRLASGMDALELILETNRERVREYAMRIDHCNTERKSIEQRMTDEALAKVVPGAAAQVIDLPEGHPGVAGIVAARVLESLGEMVPVCVLAGGHGSARAPSGFNLREAFVACDAFLTTYGGHAAAGGFATKPGMVDAFRDALCAYAAARREEGALPPPEADTPELWIETQDISLGLAEAIERLEPFGEANAEPVFGIHNVCFTDMKPMGADGKHLSVTIASSSRASRGGLRAVWWGHGDLVDSLRAAGSVPHDIVFSLIVSDYGERHAELRLRHIG